MYRIFESAMANPFDLSAMLERINTHHILGNLTGDERDRLESLARSKADPAGGLNVMAKLQELDARIAALENGNASAGDDAAAAEYVPGKWYYKGDLVTFGGSVYVCTAPEGQVCVWSPAEYPAYWEATA